LTEAGDERLEVGAIGDLEVRDGAFRYQIRRRTDPLTRGPDQT